MYILLRLSLLAVLTTVLPAAPAFGQQNTAPDHPAPLPLNLTLEVAERLEVPQLPQTERYNPPLTLPDLRLRPRLQLPPPAKAGFAKAHLQRQSAVKSGEARHGLLLDELWQRLLQSTLTPQEAPQILKPWLQLRDLLKSAPTIAMQRQHITTWLARHPEHPARQLVLRLQRNLQVPRRQERRIAVLLPQSGARQAAGTLVATGIRIAWFHLRDKLPRLPELLFLDSNQHELDLTNKIMASRVQLVIGPLTKDRVNEFARTLSEHPLHPPTLLLNETDTEMPSPRFWQFGLPVEREISALTAFAYGQGMQRAGALMIASRAGLRSGEALETSWLDLGGEWVGTEVISDDIAITDAGQSLMLLDASNRRNAMLQRIVGQKLSHIPRQRQDIDVLFVAAPGSRGHQVTAILAYNYLKGVPIFSLSSIYQPQEAGNEFDLENVTFMDMPWMIRRPEVMGYEAPELADAVYRKRLIAFGIDALNIALRLDSPPNDLLPYWGVTGLLNSEDRRIIWSPTPAMVLQGQAVPLDGR